MEVTLITPTKLYTTSPSVHTCAECAEDAIAERCPHFRFPCEPESSAEWDWIMREKHD